MAIRLRDAFHHADLSQSTISKRLAATGYNRSPGAISNYVKAKEIPPVGVLRAIAAICGVREEWLVLNNGPMLNTAPRNLEYYGQVLLNSTFPITEFNAWIKLVESLGLSEDANRHIIDFAYRMQTSIDVMGVGVATNGAGASRYHPPAEMRDAVRANFLAWTTLFESAIRSEGKENFVKKLRRFLRRYGRFNDPSIDSIEFG